MKRLEKYTLTWHNYSDHLREALQEMMSTSDFADVTLVTDDKQQIRAHRNILSACSPVFKSIFQIDSINANQVIYLSGIQHSEMESIMQFIYLGEARFCEERMREFLRVSKNLEIKELSTGIEMNYQEESNENIVPDENMDIAAAPSCNVCDQQFTTQGSLIRHIQSKHEGVKYACNQCDYQATQQSSIV